MFSIASDAHRSKGELRQTAEEHAASGFNAIAAQGKNLKEPIGLVRACFRTMTPLNPKSASALCWTALIVNGLGITATALSAQFMFSAFAAVLALVPTVLARKGTRIFGGAVLALSLGLVLTGYPNYEQDPYMQRARAESSDASAPPLATQQNHKE